MIRMGSALLWKKAEIKRRGCAVAKFSDGAGMEYIGEWLEVKEVVQKYMEDWRKRG